MEVVGALELVELAEQVAAREPQEDAHEWHERLEARAHELPAALDALLDANEHAAALQLVGSLSHFCQDAGLVDVGRGMAQQVVAAVGDAGTDVQRARAWLALGELAFRQDDQAVALEATETAHVLARRAGDGSLELRAEFNLARIAFRDADAARIRSHAERMLELAGEDPRARFGAVHMLAWAEYTAGDVTSAFELFEANVENARAARNQIGEASELLNLGSLSLESGDLAAAGNYLARGLELADGTGSSYLLPGTLTDIGRLAVLRGRTEAGLRLIAAGERQYELAGLSPDPGDDAFARQKATAIDSLGSERSAAVMAAGSELSRPEAIALARRELLTAPY